MQVSTLAIAACQNIVGQYFCFTILIEGYLNKSKDRHFIAVGALHLAGPRGLIEMLKKRGYVVKQL